MFHFDILWIFLHFLAVLKEKTKECLLTHFGLAAAMVGSSCYSITFYEGMAQQSFASALNYCRHFRGGRLAHFYTKRSWELFIAALPKYQDLIKYYEKVETYSSALLEPTSSKEPFTNYVVRRKGKVEKPKWLLLCMLGRGEGVRAEWSFKNDHANALLVLVGGKCESKMITVCLFMVGWGFSQKSWPCNLWTLHNIVV